MHVVDVIGKIYDTFGYDPSGNRIDIDVVDGVSFIDGTSNKIAEGTTVQTGGGIYKLVQGIGKLVTQHNQKTETIVEEVFTIGPIVTDPYKYLSNIPFTGGGALGGDMGNFISALSGYLSGVLTGAQANAIAGESLNVDTAVFNKMEPEIVDKMVDVKVQEQLEKMKSVDGFLGWVDKNKIWVFGSLAALVGIVILDD